MQRISVGLFKKPVKPLNAEQGVKITGNNVIDAADLFTVDMTPVRVAA